LSDALLTLLDQTNETLAAVIVIVALSILLYNITRNIRDRVARTSGGVLACVTASYIADVLLALEPGARSAEGVLRLQWIGIAFIPAAIFHLSDALLDTTGLPSRGRRRRATRLLYAVATGFLLLAALTDLVIYRVPATLPVSLRANFGFVAFLAYFGVASAIAFINVDRARRRCLTTDTRRRMAYLQASILFPAAGIFPYSAVLEPGGEFTLPALLLVNLANLLVILMLLFMAYPLSFFGSRIPDRVVKVELLRFMLRGPATGMLILGVMTYFTRPAASILGIPGDDFTPFALVTVVLFWQWMVDLALPTLEQRLVYSDEDAAQFGKVQNLNRYLLTQGDLQRLLESILAAGRNYLQTDRAFIARLGDGLPELAAQTGALNDEIERLRASFVTALPAIKAATAARPYRWEEAAGQMSGRAYWMLPLYSRRAYNGGGPRLIGLMAVETSQAEGLSEDDMRVLDTLHWRAARALDDLAVQAEIDAAIEGLLPQLSTTRERDDRIAYMPGREPLPSRNRLPARDEVVEQVQAALRHYWGGPGMANSRLLELSIVRRALIEHDNNPVKALRAALDTAIERQKPPGERDLKSQEWLIYNILYLRFIKGRKVRETANMLFMSEANLYRKQSLAIEAVADTLLQMEGEALATG
jgi:hypothetical protein